MITDAVYRRLSTIPRNKRRHISNDPLRRSILLRSVINEKVHCIEVRWCYLCVYWRFEENIISVILLWLVKTLAAHPENETIRFSIFYLDVVCGNYSRLGKHGSAKCGFYRRRWLTTKFRMLWWCSSLYTQYRRIRWTIRSLHPSLRTGTGILMHGISFVKPSLSLYWGQF